MKKGFTLIELIVVVGILGALVIAFTPSLIKTFNNQNSKIYAVKEEKLKEIAYDYVNFSEYVFPNTNYDYITDTVLIGNGFMKEIISNTNHTCKAFIRVSKSYTDYKYEPCLICEDDEYKTDVNFCDISLYNTLIGE